MSGGVVIWSVEATGNACILAGGLATFERSADLRKGISLKQKFPKNVKYHMSPEYPEDIALLDNVSNLDNYIVVSGRLRGFLEERTKEALEFLPIAIVNHKGRIASGDYFVVNPLRLEDCLDVEKSGATLSPLDKNKIIDVKKLVIDETKISEGTDVFRLRRFDRLVLVNRRLAEAMSKKGLSGLKWIEPADYKR